MVAKAHRLSKTQLTPTSPSQLLSTAYFSVKLWRNEVGYHRFGFIISKKVDKRAVARNTLKRKMIESIRVLPKKERGYDMVFYMKKSAIEISQAELEVTLSSLTAKLE